jgi:subtilisin family serine protease
MNHGMNVMSIISGNLPGRYLGAAPQVSLALARTEDTRSETNQEEDHWLAAVEWADSLGADQIQSSLGYSTFDSGQMSYAYPEMDGNTTIVTRAADMAAARGILVVNSAGNEGNMAWRRISAPCDGDSVLCVGAIDPDGEVARFSGVGPSYDGRIKPAVCALGVRTWVINASGGVGNGSGTSFSAPLISGLAACLRSAHPHRSSMDIVDAIRRSADRYSHPDSLYGYGLPNACKADSILTVMDSIRMRSHDINAHQQVIAVYPNPTGDVLTLESKIPRNLIVGIRVVTTDGKVVMELDREAFGSSSRKCLSIKHLPPGMYTLRLQLQDERTQISTFIRQ